MDKCDKYCLFYVQLKINTGVITFKDSTFAGIIHVLQYAAD
jgi:hypothetical protein